MPLMIIWRKMMKTARWIEKTHLFRSDEFICSGCGHWFRKPSSTCPYCRAKMQGAKYDPYHIDELEKMDLFFGD